MLLLLRGCFKTLLRWLRYFCIRRASRSHVNVVNDAYRKSVPLFFELLEQPYLYQNSKCLFRLVKSSISK